VAPCGVRKFLSCSVSVIIMHDATKHILLADRPIALATR
jgi:hypothetical protein